MLPASLNAWQKPSVVTSGFCWKLESGGVSPSLFGVTHLPDRTGHVRSEQNWSQSSQQTEQSNLEVRIALIDDFLGRIAILEGRVDLFVIVQFLGG